MVVNIDAIYISTLYTVTPTVLYQIPEHRRQVLKHTYCILIDCLFFDAQKHIFHTYSGREQVKKYTEMKKEWDNQEATSDCYWKSMEG